MSAKCAFPPTRKNRMYDYSESLERYRELRNLSHAASFAASQSYESYKRLKRVLHDEGAAKESAVCQNQGIRYGPVLPQSLNPETGDLGKVLDPMRVAGRGAPKKRLKPMKKKKSTSTCSRCHQSGHNRRACSKNIEMVNKEPES